MWVRPTVWNLMPFAMQSRTAFSVSASVVKWRSFIVVAELKLLSTFLFTLDFILYFYNRFIRPFLKYDVKLTLNFHINKFIDKKISEFLSLKFHSMANLMKIKDLAQERNFPLKDLAEQANLTPQALSRLMRLGSTNTETLERIAELLKVSAAIFFDGYTPPEAAPKVEQKLLSNSGQNAGRDILNGSSADKKWLAELEAQRKLTEKAQAQADRMLAIIEKMQGI